MLKKFTIIALDVILICIASLLLFAYALPSPTFGFAYTFLIISILLQIAPMILSDKVKELSNRIALYSISLFYLAVQVIISFLGFFITINKITVIIASTILFLLYTASMIILYAALKNEENVKDREKTKAFFIDKVIYKLEICRQRAKDDEILSLLENLIEAARYSNLQSCSQAMEAETGILSALDNLEKAFNEDNAKECKNECKKIASMLQERNMLCKLYK